MPSFIQRYPLGLLGALGAQVGGDSPIALLDEVRATFDATPFYLGNRRDGRDVQIAGADIQAGGNGVYVVPANSALDCDPGTARMVHYLGAYNPGAAAANFQFCVGWHYEPLGAAAPFIQHGNISSVAGAGGFTTSGGPMGAPFIQLPGLRPALLVLQGAANAVNVRIFSIFDRLSY